MPMGGGTDRPTNHLTDRPMTDRSVVVVVVVVAPAMKWRCHSEIDLFLILIELREMEPVSRA